MSDEGETQEVERDRWWKPKVSFFWTFVLVLLIAFLNQKITMPYYIFAPGGAKPVNEAVTVPPEHAYPPRGEMLYTTVSLIHAHPFDMVWSQFDSDDEIKGEKDVIGDATPEEFLERSEQSMDESRLMATAVAMKRAGYNVTQQGDGGLIKSLAEGSPAVGKLNPGDVIFTIEGKPVHVASNVTEMVRAVPTGTTLKLEVRAPDGKTRTVDITTAQRPTSRPEDPKVSYVGVVVQTANPRLDTPFQVNVDLGSVGGPSAGLAMSIALLDELTPGELTGGKEIAATGTIDLEGNVGEVGGVRQKVAAVRNKSKAKLFIVPRSEAELARKYAGSKLQVVGADNLDQAIDAIVAAGGEKPRAALPRQ